MKNSIKRFVAIIVLIAIVCAQSSMFVSAEDSGSDGFTYEIISGSTEVTITGYTGDSESIVIPDTLNGRIVSEIGDSAFAGNTVVKTVQISSNVRRILSDAFSGCTALEEVNIPASVTSVGDSAFKNCTSLTVLSLNSASTAIGNYTFEGCTSLIDISIPSGKIGYAAFRNCSSLASITLSGTVQSVGRYAFDGTAWYQNQSSGLLILDSVVYSYTGSDTEVVIPDEITCIADYAFASTSVESVVIPAGMYYIGNQAFYCCANLSYLSVPASVISIGTRAFGYSESGVRENFIVYCYDGSQALTWSESNGLTTELIDNCSHEYTQWTIGEDADCTNDGYEYRRCIKCNSIETETLSATGHVWSDWVVVSEYSCTQDEVQRRTCTVCGETEDSVTQTTGHVWNEWVVTKNPDCTNEGEQYHVCSVCGVSEAETIAANGHTWIVDETTDSEGWFITEEADCTSAGSKLRVCSVCGYVENEVVEPLGHQAEEWTVLKEATAFNEGLRQGVCTVCGETFTEVIPIISDVLPDDVKMLTLNDDSYLSFNDERTCVLGITTGTSVGDVISEFEYSDYIISVSIDTGNQGISIVDSTENAATGLFLFLIGYDSTTGDYTYIDTMCLIVKGDLDGSGTVSVADARLALRVSAGLEALGSAYELAGDLDGSGAINVSEARTILRVASKLENME